MTISDYHPLKSNCVASPDSITIPGVSNTPDITVSKTSDTTISNTSNITISKITKQAIRVPLRGNWSR
ncbi:hypothetical protein G9A89_009924 [Geosiphon pyriformis]|nr:hypothetical protein G9A89_009924 [Geosiphon pyriformis]